MNLYTLYFNDGESEVKELAVLPDDSHKSIQAWLDAHSIEADLDELDCFLTRPDDKDGKIYTVTVQ